MILKGRVWRIGDHVDTDQILPAGYINLKNRRERAAHCFETIIPHFASSVEPGDFVVAGINFGCGSSRPSVEILQDLQLGGVVARSFARIFFRGGIARGFPLIICPELSEEDLPQGHRIEIDTGKGTVLDVTAGNSYASEKYPPFLNQIINEGGLMEVTYRRLNESIAKAHEEGTNCLQCSE